MKKKSEENPSEVESPIPDVQLEPSTEVATTESQEDAITNLFHRQGNSTSPIKNITFKTQLTKELVAMAHRNQLLFTCKSDMYTFELPASGRTGAMQKARVIDGVDEETNTEIMLVMNEIMVSSLRKCGYRVIQFTAANGDHEPTETVVGDTSVVGHSFAFRAGKLNADKGYRYIDVVEVELSR